MISNLIVLAVLLPVAPVSNLQPEYLIRDSEQIDAIIDHHLQVQKIPAADRCSDDVFLRRVTLDLAGRIPSAAELESFRKNPDRRGKIDELLASSEFNRFAAEIWTASLVGYLNVFGTDREALRIWMEDQIRDDRPWDQIASELITATGSSSLDGPVNFLVRNRDDPVVKVGRMFLGVRLDCAQCHDHPFDRWTQDDYRQMRRFFGQLQTQQVNGTVNVQDRIRQQANSQAPVFLTGAQPQTDHWRAELALFVTNSKPFARNFGNRIWYHLMGRGIVHPVDDFNASNPATLPQLVEFLADQARANQFSVREMTRLICNSEAYQRATGFNDEELDSARFFARRILKPMTPGQFVDSVVLALDLKLDVAQKRQLVRTMIGDALQEDFSETWAYRESVQMAMARFATPLESQPWSVTELYQRILTRDPSAEELLRCQDEAIPDIAFALVHSNEFFLNH